MVSLKKNFEWQWRSQEGEDMKLCSSSIGAVRYILKSSELEVRKSDEKKNKTDIFFFGSVFFKYSWLRHCRRMFVF